MVESKFRTLSQSAWGSFEDVDCWVYGLGLRLEGLGLEIRGF